MYYNYNRFQLILMTKKKHTINCMQITQDGTTKCKAYYSKTQIERLIKKKIKKKLHVLCMHTYIS